ncbi:hypothetical protein [Longimicrobium sp.]|uniref:hypothetical protein n=1 Tax=Longimicrobium sp. TaxID=2029185 RepID=UPI002E32871E|nr:hypothetical protein [Longimicrobium sp.]HEX6037845.1 hypothetical protein [Longimicrobium sp.]
MMRSRVLVAFAAAMLAACGGGDEGAAEGGAATDTTTTTITTPSDADVPPTPPGTADTAGVGTNPPTAGGQIVDTAGVPGPVDTAQGTATAP